MCLHPFAWTNVSSEKNAGFAIWARVDTKFLNLSHHVLSMDGWPGDATFFPVGPTFEDHPQVFSQKGPAPWNLFLTPAPRPLQVTFVGWWSWTYVVVAFCKDKFIFSKKTCVLDFGRALALTQNSWICPIISYLWMVGLVMRLFSCGANLWRSSAGIQPKKVQPLGIYFWHVRLGLFLVKLNICGCSLLQGQIYFQQKNLCFAFWARVDTKFLNLFHHVLSMDGWPGDATFFLWGQPLKIIRRYSAKRGPAPWNLFLTRAPLASSSHLFGLVKLNICGCRLLQGQMYVQQKTGVLDFGRALALTQNFWICPVISYLWMVGLVMRLFSCGANLWRSSACIQPKKGPAPWNLFLTRAPWPLQVTFLVGEAEHMWL